MTDESKKKTHNYSKYIIIGLILVIILGIYLYSKSNKTLTGGSPVNLTGGSPVNLTGGSPVNLTGGSPVNLTDSVPKIGGGRINQSSVNLKRFNDIQNILTKNINKFNSL